MQKITLKFASATAFGGKEIPAGTVVMTGEIPDGANPMKLPIFVGRGVLTFDVEPEGKTKGDEKPEGKTKGAKS